MLPLSEIVPELIAYYPQIANGIIEPVKGGTAGDSAVITTPAGKYFLRRRAPEHSGEGQLEFEHKLLIRLQEHDFPVPPLIANSAGQTYTRVGEETIVTLYAWLRGGAHEPGNICEVTDLARNLAVFHQITAKLHLPGKEQPIEDEPGFLLRETDRLLQNIDLEDTVAARRDALTAKIRAALTALQAAAQKIQALPHTVIHGDLHPGNTKFQDGRLTGLFDFDWANHNARVRDLSDALLFFCRENGFDAAEDIWGLTQGFILNRETAERFLAAYEETGPIHPEEQAALPYFMARRWLQVRIRGARKVPPARRLEFVDRDDLFTMLSYLQGWSLQP